MSVVNVEERFLHSLLISPKQEQERLYRVLDPSVFSSVRDEIIFIKEHYTKYKEIPSLGIFLEKFPDSCDEKSEDSVFVYYDEIRSRKLCEIAKKGLKPVVSSLQKEMDGFKVASAIKALSGNLCASESVEYGAWSDTSERVLQYRRKKDPNVLSFEPPFKFMQKLVYRFVEGNLITVFARPGSGKTWISCLLALESANQGIPTAIYSPEMSKAEIHDRLDGIRFNLPWDEFVRGSMSIQDTRRYDLGLKKLKEENPPLYVVTRDAKNCSIDQLPAMIEELGISVLILDGAHQLQSKGNSLVEKAYYACRQVKQEACIGSNIIVIQTVQEGRPKPGEKRDSPAWSDAYLQESDVLIKVEGEEGSNIREFHIVKARNGMCGSGHINMQITPLVNIREKLLPKDFVEVDV